MNNSQSQEISISNETDDGELFEMMVGKGETGLAAFDVFYRRYVKGLHKRTCRIKGLAQADKEDFVQEAMLRAYRFAHKFKSPDSSLSKSAKRNKTMAWLVKIARNLHLEKLRKLKADGVKGFTVFEVENEDGEFSHFVTDELHNGEGFHQIREAEERAIPGLIPPEDGKTNSERIKNVKVFLNGLPEKKRDVILAYFGDEYDYRNPKKPLSRELIESLKDKHDLTSANLRQIKKRTFEAAEKELKEKE